MAINSNVVSHFFHFRPDDDWSIQLKRRQSYFSELKLVTDNLSLFMQQPTEKPLKMYIQVMMDIQCSREKCFEGCEGNEEQ